MFAFRARNTASVPSIYPREARERLQNEPGIVVLDVRTPEEYADGHLPGSVLLPLTVVPLRATEVLPDRDATIFVYCHSGARSAQAATLLARMGYTRVWNLGGIVHWPYETER